MNILIVHSYYRYWAGEEAYFESLVNLLKQKRHNVYTLSRQSQNVNTFFDKVKVAFGLIWNIDVMMEFIKIVRTNKLDIVHIHNVYPMIGPTIYFLCRVFKLPVVQTINNYRFICHNGLLFRDGKRCELCVGKSMPFYSVIYGCYGGSRLRSLLMFISFNLHRYVFKSFKSIRSYQFPSLFTLKYYAKHFVDTQADLVFLPYFISPPKVNKIARKSDYFLFVGRLSEEKGIVKLLDFFKFHRNYKLRVIGTGPLLKRMVAYKDCSNIQIVGFKERRYIYEEMKRCIALIIPSLWYEVLPNVLLEAVTQGVSLITFKHLNLHKLLNVPPSTSHWYINRFSDLTNILPIVQKYKSSRSQTSIIKVKKILTPDYHYKKLLAVYLRVQKKCI